MVQSPHPPILQIVPRLPPVLDGIGDYSTAVARCLRQNWGRDTHFIVGDPTWPPTEAEFQTWPLAERSVPALLQALEGAGPGPVILHYVSYGYARRGCPFWLVNGLEQWKRMTPNAQLVTMFHEVYAYDVGPPWTSSFWLSPLQRQLAIRLGFLSDRAMTNRQHYAQMVETLTQGHQQQIPALPVFSTVGEPTDLAPLIDRPRRLVVFGSRISRRRVYERGTAALAALCHQLGIREVWDIGSSVDLNLAGLLPIPIVETGCLPIEAISPVMQQAIAGFFDYHTEYLGKSTIFAAYCAHRLIPIGLYYSPEIRDDLVSGQQYWLADRPLGDLTLEMGQAIADRAHHWYQAHRLEEHAKVLVTLLDNRHGLC
ncbi:hypothetical protein BST81_08575 [Leptolyngbya sp. 'hensonii']|uniref:hypothetical protein n=1 Tax=Leptolyngbya sp. 'hensonii' TaxID=1922337 RepID=UPI00094FC2BB|nr:hypothetical protein [Leptolyngbya sp. 'hensonii']OLP18784.1 hypothetical protein BST81_08575 [Leptolyngbya sp. 'hensonii']